MKEIYLQGIQECMLVMHRLYCLVVISPFLTNILKLLQVRLLAGSLEGVFFDVHLVKLSFLGPKGCVL